MTFRLRLVPKYGSSPLNAINETVRENSGSQALIYHKSLNPLAITGAEPAPAPFRRHWAAPPSTKQSRWRRAVKLPHARSPSDRLAILAVVGTSAVVPCEARACTGCRRRSGRHEHDRLIAADARAVDLLDRVTHLLQSRANELVELGLHFEPVAQLVMAEARHVGCKLQVGAEVEHIHQRLSVALRLHIAAHQRDRHQRRFVLHDEARGERVEWPLVRG